MDKSQDKKSATPLTLEAIRKVIPPELFIKDELHFLVDVFYSVSLTILTAWLANNYLPYTLLATPLWFAYAFICGTIATGVWVLGHECGHGAFSENKLANDILGFVLHIPLLVPFFSWQHSHYVHH